MMANNEPKYEVTKDGPGGLSGAKFRSLDQAISYLRYCLRASEKGERSFVVSKLY